MSSNFIVAETVRRQHVAQKSISLRNQRVKFYCFIMSVILCASLLYVWTRIRVVQVGYELSKLNKQTEELAGEKSILESEVAALKSPHRLGSIARDHFHMRLPHGNEIVTVDQ